MADVEDDADFGSHFLDSMLEVQMTEGDKELDIPKSYDTLDTLPPVPTFDLQAETLSYKEFYNTFPQPVLATLPIATTTASTVPLVIKPSSMLIYSGEVTPSQPAPVLTPVPAVPPKPVTKSVKLGVDVNSPEAVSLINETLDKKFLKQVFLPDFVKKVFVKADPPWDIALLSEEEMKYYNNCFSDVSKVQICKLHCTICNKHLGCALSARKKINVHSMLKVLTCKPCFNFYGDGNFPCDKGDNCEIYCRWCGQGGALVCCSFCPRVFCKKCVKRNFGIQFLRKIEKATDWACFCCAQKPLWPHRAICRALLEFLQKKKTDPKIPAGDTTSCCNFAGLTLRKKLRGSPEKNKTGTPERQIKFTPPAKTPEAKNKTYPSPKTVLDEQLLVKPVVRMKSNEKPKLATTATRNSTPKPKTITNIFSPRSIIAGNNVIRGIATATPTKLFSAFPTPQLIQGPVMQGEPLMGSSPRILVQSNPPGNSGFNSSCVRVSLTHQAPSLDVNKIPTVKVPQLVQGLFLRLIFPDNKMQYVRLVFDGMCNQPSKDFPMPQFKEKGASFVEENLAEAFKISKMMYEKLMRINEKVSSRTKITEKSVFNSSVKKLHVDYENIIELYRELDRTLLENHEEWKNEGKNSVDVIDLSDDETSTGKKSKPTRNSTPKETRKNPSDDSDIEILEDVPTANGKPPNGNFKEKYRLRSSTDLRKIHLNDTLPVRKRKRGRLRNTDKRLKINRVQNGQPEEDPLKTDDVETEEPRERGEREIGGVEPPRGRRGDEKSRLVKLNRREWVPRGGPAVAE